MSGFRLTVSSSSIPSIIGIMISLMTRPGWAEKYFIESFFPVLSRGYIVLVLQDIFDKMAQLGVVFHDQY